MHSLANKQRVLSWTHIAGAIARGLEIHQESSNRAIRTTCVALSTPYRKLRKTNVQTSTSDRSRRVNACERKFALSCRHSLAPLPRITLALSPTWLPGSCAAKNAQAAAQEAAAEAPKQASSLLLQRAHEQRSDCSSGVLGMLVEAMTFAGMEHAEHATALVSHRMRCAFDAIAETIWQRNGLAFPASSECTAQLSSAANCARCKYRLTPHGTDRRSNRQRFTNEQRGRWCRRRKSMALRCVFAAVWHRYQPTLPLAGPVRV